MTTTRHVWTTGGENRRGVRGKGKHNSRMETWRGSFHVTSIRGRNVVLSTKCRKQKSVLCNAVQIRASL